MPLSLRVAGARPRVAMPVRCVALVALLAAVCGRGAVARAAERLAPAPEGSFSIVVVPDTQRYLGRGTKGQPKSTDPVTNPVFDSHVQWIVDNAAAQRVAMVSHVGDIVDRNVADQWAVARRTMDRLHGLLPYGISPGNHDMKASGDSSLFQQHFAAERFARLPWYGGCFVGGPLAGSSGNNANSFQLISAGGVDWVIVHLECNAPDDVLAWADGILAEHAARRALVTTHMWLGPLEKPKDEADFTDAPKGRMRWHKTHGSRGNSPEAMWHKSLRKHANLVAIFCGDQSRSQAMHEADAAQDGHPVHAILSDYNQAKEPWLRVCRFLPAAGRIEIRTVDSRSGELCDGTKLCPDRARHQFSVDAPLCRPPATAR